MEEHGKGAISKTPSKEDFNEICRCCLSPAPLSSIFELIYEETPLVDIFCSLFGAQLDPNDGLPKKICESCICEVIRFYNFKKCYETSEATLLNIIVKRDDEMKSESPEEDFALGETQLSEKIITDSKENIKCDIDGVIMKRQKKSNIFTCSCEETFASKLEFRQHRELTNHLIPRNHPCETCRRLFTKQGLWKHRKIHDAVKRYSCDCCTMKFASSGNLRRHKMTHTGEKPHVCEFCGKSFIQLVTMKVHRRIHTGEKPYLCNFCGKTFRGRLSYKIHMHNHNQQKSSDLNRPLKRKSKGKSPKATFVCDKCGRHCYSQGSYKLHLYKHGLGTEQVFVGDRHQCEICMKFYATQSGLIFHMLTHDEKQFLCSECGKRFYVKAALESHLLTHTGEKSFSCEFCSKKFARQPSLQRHLHVHTGERPFACALCPKKFRQSTHLTAHLTVHTGERPYICKFCGKSFPHKNTHNVHIRTHTGEKPFKCDLCTNMFYDSGSLKKHKQRKHPQI